MYEKRAIITRQSNQEIIAGIILEYLLLEALAENLISLHGIWSYPVSMLVDYKDKVDQIFIIPLILLNYPESVLLGYLAK